MHYTNESTYDRQKIYLHQPSMIPAIIYGNLLLIQNSVEIDRIKIYTPRSSTGQKLLQS